MNIIYLGRENKETNGGSIVSERNMMVLKEISEKFFYFLVDYKGIYKKLKNIILGRPLGYDVSIVESIKRKSSEIEIDFIFIDHSLLGGFSSFLTQLSIPIITFFHNVEYIYYTHKMRIEGIYNIPMLYWARRNELKAIRNSTYVITLTKRDSNKLLELYGRKADLILPTSIKDDFVFEGIDIIKSGFHLFVGSSFFANIHGIEWYIRNVLDDIESKLLIIGKGWEFLNEIFQNKNFEVLGFVKDIGEYYKKADFVINPVFFGSGMKTKTIEALMYGKVIFGTKEAFIGIENLKNLNFLFECRDSDEFIQKISKKDFKKFSYEARNYFLENFSMEKSVEKLHDLLFLNKEYK